MTSPKVGDKLKVISERHGHEFGIGDIVTVVREHGAARSCFKCESSDGEWWWLYEGEYELVSTPSKLEALRSDLVKYVPALAEFEKLLTDEISQKYEQIIEERVHETLNMRTKNLKAAIQTALEMV